MKEVFLIRHAKSSWDRPSLSDRDRPLNTRGKRDAPFMSGMLADLFPSMDLIISSPAKRALTTAKYFASTYQIPKKEIKIVDNLYHGDPSDITQAIQSTDEKYYRIAIFGHNPGWTYFANLVPNVRIDNIPACAS